MTTSDAPSPPFDFSELISELRVILRNFVDGLHDVFAIDAPWELLDVAPDSPPDALPVERYPIYHHLEWLYRYAFFGQRDGDPEDHMQQVVTFLETYLRLPESSLCLHTVQTAVARWKLDSGTDDLSFREIALLAHMDEKSVRNAANPKSRDALPTYSESGRTWIRCIDAREWLIRRRGFVPTSGVTALPQLPFHGFPAVSDVSRFIRQRIEQIGKRDLVSELRRSSIRERDLARLTRGEIDVPLPAVGAIGKLLGYDPGEFTVAVTHAVFPRK